MKVIYAIDSNILPEISFLTYQANHILLFQVYLFWMKGFVDLIEPVKTCHMENKLVYRMKPEKQSENAFS